MAQSMDKSEIEEQALREKYKKAKLTAIRFIYTLYTLKAGEKGNGNDGGVRIHFHDDADGLSGAFMMYRLLREMGIDITRNDLILHTYQGGGPNSQDDTAAYRIYVDIQPRTIKRNELVVDHHRLIDEHFKYRFPSMEFTEHTFIIWPESGYEDLFLPVSAGLLCSYLYHTYTHLRSKGIDDLLSFDRFLADMDPDLISSIPDLYDYFYGRSWEKDKNIAYLLLLGQVSDNLWLLSLKEGEFLYNIVKERYGNVDGFIKESMALSLMLGDHTLSKMLISALENALTSGSDFRESVVANTDPYVPRSANLYDFALQLVSSAEKAVLYIKRKVEEEISTLKVKIGRIEGELEAMKANMPIQMKSSRDYTEGMLVSQSDKSDIKWQRIEFFSREVKKLERSFNIERRRLNHLIDVASRMENPRGLVVFIPPQPSGQVKGILSSLIYYFGKNNIVIEEHEAVSYWGSRGLSRSDLESELTSFDIEAKRIDYYVAVSEVAEDLPQALKKGLDYFSNFIRSETKYVGGGGGRGLVFGGSITGSVPQMMQMFRPQELKNVLEELRRHNELARALKALSEKALRVPISKALLTKFSDSDWVTLVVRMGGRMGDLMHYGVEAVDVWYRGYNMRYNL